MLYARIVFICLSVFVLVACGGGGDDGGGEASHGSAQTEPGPPNSGDPVTNPAPPDSGDPVTNPAQSDFSLSMTERYTIVQGSSATLAVTIEGEGDPGTVSLSLSGSSLLSRNDADNNIGYFFSDVDTTGGNLILNVGADVPEDSYHLTVTGEAGGKTRSASFELQVQKPADLANLNYGIVYARVPRNNRIIHIDENEYPDGLLAGHDVDLAMYDRLPEVGHILSGFTAPGQLVWRHEDESGETIETIIFDCVDGMPAEGVVPPKSRGDDACVPMDPAVSFDGKKVAFSVYHGTYAHHSIYQGPVLESGMISGATSARIYIYDFESGKLTPWPHPKDAKGNDVWDTAPVWLPRDDNESQKIMFSSTRAGVSSRRIKGAGARKLPVMQLWIANADGSEPHLVSPHDQIGTGPALHPFVHSSGRVLYSDRQLNAMRLWTVSQVTEDNQWWLVSVDRRGGDFHAHWHAHAPGVSAYEVNGPYTTKALHFIGERSNGDVCVDNYYERDNNGAGEILCWPAQGASHTPLGHEGSYRFNHPDGWYIGVPGDSSDQNHDNAKVRDPAGIPGGGLMFAGGVGPTSLRCHTSYYSRVDAVEKGLTCDIGIYMLTNAQVEANAEKSRKNAYNGVDRRHLNAELIVNSPDWHEFMPKPVVKYEKIYPGKDQPDRPHLPSTGGDPRFGIFASANAHLANLKTSGGWRGPANGNWCKFQGCAMQALIEQENSENPELDRIDAIKYIRFWKAIPNQRWHSPATSNSAGFPMDSNWGQRMELMGDVKVQDDGSFKAKLPANEPFLMAGVDENGRAVARHKHLMSLRPGEEIVCVGCHLHDTSEEWNKRQANAFDLKLAASKSAVEPKILFAGEKRMPEWEIDIYPMLQANCASCHDGGSNSSPPNFAAESNELYVELTNNGYRRAAHIGGGTDNAHVADMPWMTRYLNAYFARESLLYWKAAGKRTDGRTDQDLPLKDDKGKVLTITADFDFGKAHKSYLTEQELRMLGDWIEAGAYRCQPNNMEPTCEELKSR